MQGGKEEWPTLKESATSTVKKREVQVTEGETKKQDTTKPQVWGVVVSPEEPVHPLQGGEEEWPTLKESATSTLEKREVQVTEGEMKNQDTPKRQVRGLIFLPKEPVHPLQGGKEEWPTLKESTTSAAGGREVKARKKTLPRQNLQQDSQLKNGMGRLTRDIGGHFSSHGDRPTNACRPTHSAPAGKEMFTHLNSLLQKTVLDLEWHHAMLLTCEAEKEELLKEKKKVQQILRQEYASSELASLKAKAAITHLKVQVMKSDAQASDARKGQHEAENLRTLDQNLWMEEKEKLLQENNRLQQETEVLQLEALRNAELQRELLASQKVNQDIMADLSQQQAEKASLLKAKEEADQALLLLQQRLSEEHRKQEETEEMEALHIPRAERRRSPFRRFLASIRKWMRRRE